MPHAPSNFNISQARLRLLYRAISMALIASMLTTPIALVISYKFSKSRYDRIAERQVDEFRQIIFNVNFGQSESATVSKRVAEYLSVISAKAGKDATLSYINIVDEFGQTITEQNTKTLDGQKIRLGDVRSCLESIIPILTYGADRYFCAKSDLTNGRVHYGFYGAMRVSDKVISDFIGNTVLMCLFTFAIAVAVSGLQYYVSLRISNSLIRSNVKTLFLLGNTIALRDNDTYHHNLRVMIYSYYLGKIVKLSHENLHNLITGSLLHDIGKIGIPDAVLNKPGKLTFEEFEVIKTHVGLGEKIMVNSEWDDRATDVIKYHHERFDGDGYMEKLSGEHIPFNARMFAIVDVFDALTSTRPYKQPCSYEDTMAYIISQKGKHFDPELVEKFVIISRTLFNRFANRADDTVTEEANRILNTYYA